MAADDGLVRDLADYDRAFGLTDLTDLTDHAGIADGFADGFGMPGAGAVVELPCDEDVAWWPPRRPRRGRR